MQKITEFNIFELDDSINTIKHKLIKSKTELDDKDDVALGSLFISLIRCRHDLVHVFLQKYLKIKLSPEERIGNIIKNMPKSLAKLSPDILFYDKNKNRLLIIEVSVSQSPATSESIKVEKYSGLVKYLIDVRNIDVLFFPFCVDSLFTNIRLKIEELEELLWRDFETSKNGFDHAGFQVLISVWRDIRLFTTRNISSEFLDKLIQNRFLKVEEKRGMYRDVDINIKKTKELSKEKYDYKKVIEGIKTNNIENFKSVIKEILEDENDPVNIKMRDIKNNVNQYYNANKINNESNEIIPKMDPKPSHHYFVPDIYLDQEIKLIDGKKSEQEMLINFFRIIKEIEPTESNFEFVKRISERTLKIFDGIDGEKHRNMFDTGNYIVEEDGIKLKQEYSKEFERHKKNRKHYQSYRSFLQEKNILKDMNKDFVEKRKTIRLDTLEDVRIKDFWVETSISHKKSKPSETIKSEHKTIDPIHMETVDKMIEWLSEEVEAPTDKLEDFLKYETKIDSPNANGFKKEYREKYMELFLHLKKTRCYRYMKYMHHISQQMMHFQLLNLTTKSFAFFNSGIPNLMYIVAGCYNRLTSENGKPFCIVWITDKPQDYNSFFGTIKKLKIDEKRWLLMTNWRRLPVFKITHIRDSFFSILSSTMNSILSAQKATTYTTEKIYKIFSLRSLIGCCTNQSVAENLMNVRYAYMSAFSSHTNIEKLLIDKFSPPYKTAMDYWIFDKMTKKLPIIFNSVIIKGEILIKIPGYDGDYRRDETRGGLIKVPSLWFDWYLVEAQEILDEAFIYVHTMKEPSNIFHEEIKAIKTIIEFQEKYDSLPEWRKNGNVISKNIRTFMLDSNPIGCISYVINDSVKHTISIEKPFFDKYVDEINEESISEIISTKAVIHDINRELEKTELSTREKYKIKKRYEYIHSKELSDEELKKMDSYYLKSNSTFYDEKKPRQKVIETILDLIQSKNIGKTIELANWFIENEQGRVLADICIKSQYGSKREFYVINIGAKALARCSENFFKNMCKNSPNEAISIPGDEKLIEMQRMLDSAYKTMIEKKLKMRFVNGDCTKWSAAETMASFISMTYALKEKIPTGMYELLKFTYCTWANKEIQVPINILKKTVPKGVTAYLQNIENGRMRSTHNFLQGMFNYASSYKAVCCGNYTIKLWKEFYPDSELELFHMEHSDDYVLIILYKDEKEFEKFRILHKMLMKCHGYNDSERKTSCQSFLMEFVSLMSFNGTMLYPQIKKSKEINLNLPCTGYRSDMDAAMSRIGECMRIGCNQTFLYFMERLHAYCVAEAYSILPGMENSMERNLTELFESPVELFGIPDTLPIFSLFCKGSVNNYRLYYFGSDKIKKTLKYLYLLGKKKNMENLLFENDSNFSYSFYNPRYFYEYDNKSIFKIRQHLNISEDEIKKFWDDHISYKFMKPRNKKNLIDWIKCMFYDRSFTEAYTKLSRTRMTMRISKFVKSNILKSKINIEEMKGMIYSNFLTIKESYKELITEIEGITKIEMNKLEETIFLKILTKSDPTPSAIYSTLSRLIIYNKRKKISHPIAMRTPYKLKTYYIENNPQVLLQYYLNKEDYEKDNRVVKTDISLFKDIQVIENIHGEILKMRNPLGIMAVFNDLMINRSKQLVMIGYNKKSRMLSDCVKDIISYNSIPYTHLDINFSGEIEVRNPYNQKLHYLKVDRLTPDLNRQHIETLTILFVVMKIKCEMSDRDIRGVFEKIRFKELNKKITVSELINRFSVDYLDEYDLSMTEKKIIAFFRQYYLDDISIAESLIKGAYMFSYKYDKKANAVGSTWYGKTIATFMYMKRLFKMFQMDQENPILISETSPSGYIIPAYNVALNLGNLLTQKELEYTTHQNRVITMKIKYDQKIMNFCSRNNIYGVMTYDSGKIGTRRIIDLIENEEILPVLLTRRKINPFQGQRYDIGVYKPEIRGISVVSGKMKMYTLPYWQCRQYDTLYCTDDTEIMGMELNLLFRNNMLFNYVSDRKFNFKGDIIIDNSLIDDMVFFMNKMIPLINIKKIPVPSEKKDFLFDYYDINEQPDILEMKEETIDVGNIGSLDMQNLHNLLGIDLDFELLDEEMEDDVIDDNIGILELDDIAEDIQRDSQSYRAEMIRTFGEIDVSDVSFLLPRHYKVSNKMSYMIQKLKRLPEIRTKIIMEQNKCYLRKRNRLGQFIKNLEKCIEMAIDSRPNFRNNEKSRSLYFYSLLAINEAITNCDIVNETIGDVGCEYNPTSSDFLFFKFIRLQNTPNNLMKIKSKEVPFKIENNEIILKIKITLTNFFNEYNSIVGIRYTYFGIEKENIYSNIHQTDSDEEIDWGNVLF